MCYSQGVLLSRFAYIRVVCTFYVLYFVRNRRVSFSIVPFSFDGTMDADVGRDAFSFSTLPPFLFFERGCPSRLLPRRTVDIGGGTRGVHAQGCMRSVFLSLPPFCSVTISGGARGARATVCVRLLSSPSRPSLLPSPRPYGEGALPVACAQFPLGHLRAS